jgi:glycosyltransferase involved in cell wall biosynthesis
MMSMDALEFWGQISLLKGGIRFSDSITTVSPTYAREILTKEYGSGFEGVLATRAKDLHGILNGIDPERWDPRRDPFLPEPYDEHSLEKKDAAKRALFDLLCPGTPFEPLARPLVGIVSRLVDQKGFDLVSELAPVLPDYGSFAVLGTGDPRYETLLRDLALKHPDRFAVKIGFDESLAHLIEGAADDRRIAIGGERDRLTLLRPNRRTGGNEFGSLLTELRDYGIHKGPDQDQPDTRPPRYIPFQDAHLGDLHPHAPSLALHPTRSRQTRAGSRALSDEAGGDHRRSTESPQVPGHSAFAEALTVWRKSLGPEHANVGAALREAVSSSPPPQRSMT